ncbi:MAG: hypothetical protein HEEMFOPI_00227 [Holosporales bacterium]
MFKTFYKKINIAYQNIKYAFIVGIFTLFSISTSIASQNVDQSLQNMVNDAEQTIEQLNVFIDPVVGEFRASLYQRLDSFAEKSQTATANDVAEIKNGLNELINFANAAVEFFSIRRDIMFKIQTLMQQNPQLVEPIFQKFNDVGTRFRNVTTVEELKALSIEARAILNS